MPHTTNRVKLPYILRPIFCKDDLSAGGCIHGRDDAVFERHHPVGHIKNPVIMGGE